VWSPQGAGSLRWAEEDVLSDSREQTGGRPRAFRRERRENLEGGRTGKRFVVRSGPGEELRLRLLAQEQGVTVPRLLVETTLAANAPGAREGALSMTERRQAAAELFQIERLLGTVSNNVNQMAKVANATGEVSEDLAATLRYLREVLGPRLERAVDEVVAP
jgi:hypothetical protein